MSTHRTCGKCGSVVDSAVLHDFCIQCLLDSADTEDSAGAGETGTAVRGLSESDSPQFLVRVGDYDLLEEIARGGMGVVFKAWQRSLQRTVAVKMVLSGRFAGKAMAERFKAEAIAAALLRHPNIVGIHEVGLHEGQPYFSMEFVEGQDLSRFVGNRPLPSKSAAGILKKISKAVHYAHEQGVLHRDLKPSNVLIDTTTNEPRLTDFGLAKRLERPSDLTVTGQVLGSPNFMPPEQASPSHGKVGRESDVYGLGAILYYLLTGRAPFQNESLPVLMAEVVNDEPIPPRLLNSNVPRDLETICLKCLEKSPERRYPTANELMEELDRFLQDEPILGCPITRVERIRRWGARRPALAITGTVALMLLLVVVLGAPIALVQINRARVAATSARVEADQNLYAADMKLVSEAVKNGAYNHARELLERHRPSRGQTDFRGFEWRYFWKTVEDHEPVRTLTGLPATTGWEDGTLVVKGETLYNQSGTELRAWNINTWEQLPLAKPPEQKRVDWVWFPEAGRVCMVDNSNAVITLFTVPTLDKGTVLRLPGQASGLSLSADGERLAAAVQSGAKLSVVVWDVLKKVEIARVGEYEVGVKAIVFSSNKSSLAVIRTNSELDVWNLPTLKRVSLPNSETTKRRHIYSVSFFPEDDRLLIFQDEGIRVWDMTRQVKPLASPGGSEQDAFFGFSPDRRLLLTSQNRADLNLFDARTLQFIGTLRGHLGLTRGTAYSPNGKLLATASVDQTVRIWDLATLRELAVLGGFGERISDVKFTPNGENIVLISGFGMLKVYGLKKVLNEGLFAIDSDLGGFSSVALSPDNRTLAARSVSGNLLLWDRESGRQVHSFPFEDDALAKISFSPDGKRLAWSTRTALEVLSLDSNESFTMPLVGNRDRSDVGFSPDGSDLAFGCGKHLFVLDLKTRRQHPFATCDDEVFALEYSPDGRFIAFGDRLGTLTLCEQATGRVLTKAKAHPPHVYSVAFSPDGRLLASSGAESSIKLWSVSPAGLLLKATLRGHMGYVSSVSFSPNANRLVSAAGDRTLKIWDPVRGVELATLYGHSDYVRSARFDMGGNAIYSAGFGSDRQIRIWDSGSTPAGQIKSSARSKTSKKENQHASQ